MPKKTKNRLAFEREVKRLSRFVKQAEKQGVYFPDEVVPAIPKRITKKALEKIQLTTRADVQSKGYVVDYETGEAESFTPAPSKKRYLSQIKPLQTTREKQKSRKQAAAKAVVTKRTNAALKRWNIPNSAEAQVRKIVTSDYTEEEQETFLRKISKFYNPFRPDLWDPEAEKVIAEPEPEEEPESEPEPPKKKKRPVIYDDDEEPEFFDVPSPDDYDEEPVDGFQTIIDRLEAMLTAGKNEATKKVVSDALHDAINQTEGDDYEEKKKNFVDNIRPNLNKLMQKLYDAFTKVYPDEIADAAFEALSYCTDFVDSDLQAKIEAAADRDGSYSTVNRRWAQRMGWMP